LRFENSGQGNMSVTTPRLLQGTPRLLPATPELRPPGDLIGELSSLGGSVKSKSSSYYCRSHGSRSAPTSDRSAHSRSISRRSGSQASTASALMAELRDFEIGSVLAAPWGPKRANEDQPPHDELLEKRRQYHRMLDEQAKMEGSRRKHKKEQAVENEQTYVTSLETKTHTWGAQAIDVDKEKAMFNELVATAASRQRRSKEARDYEKQDYKKWAEAAEMEQAMSYQQQREQKKEKCMSLAESWKMAAQEKEERAKAERQKALQEERQMLDRLTEGMAPSRPMKKCRPPAAILVTPRRRPAGY